jgi:6-pyruvoyltetrahydropterin/6-carboxytetrahydropterin synthase
MPTTITKRYAFEAAHFLPKVPEGHKCKRVHGHNYEIEVTVKLGPLGDVANDGFVIDFWDLDDIVDPIVETVDHRTLNDIAGLDNPTAEFIAGWFLAAINLGLRSEFANIFCTQVVVYETKNCFATVTLP